MYVLRMDWDKAGTQRGMKVELLQSVSGVARPTVSSALRTIAVGLAKLADALDSSGAK